MPHKKSAALYAIVDLQGCVLWTQGGSSTPPKLMVYETQAKAIKALRYVSMGISVRIAQLQVLP